MDGKPAALLMNSEVMTEWSPYRSREAHPYFGGYDGLGGRMMHVAKADIYDASPNPWPNNGQFDRPNGLFSIFAGRMEKRHETSAHPGYTVPTGPGPSMLFHAPPLFSIQQQPIPAVGI